MTASRHNSTAAPYGIPARASGCRRWFAVYVRSRHEFRVDRLLADTGIESFLPTVERLRRWKDRKKLVTFALFPGYLFVHIGGARDEMLSVLRTHGVVRFISMRPGSPEPVPERQIESLQKLVAEKADLEAYPYVREGQRVRIVHGALAGVEGLLQQRRGRHMLVLSVDILQQGASVSVDAVDVQPV